MNNLIYTDSCSELNKLKIKSELGLEIINGIDPKIWTLSDAISILMLPSVKLAVINIISEVTVLEMAILHFMCKPILITSKTIFNYPVLEHKIIDDICFDCDLRSESSTFIKWYKEQDYL